MLKYFKKENGRRKKSDSKFNEDGDVTDSTKNNSSLRSTSSFCDEIFLEEEFSNIEDEDARSVGGALSISTSSADYVLSEDEDTFKHHSRLSMSLLSIINDPDCLCFFLQFLETKNELGLIKFYLDVENFKKAVKSQIGKSENLKNFDKNKNSTENEVQPTTLNGTEEEKTNFVPEFKAIFDLSMRKPLTDDEKSKIYAENNKQIFKCNSCHHQSNSESSLYGESIAPTEIDDEYQVANEKLCDASIRDAIVIYKKYLIADAKYLVSLPVMILSQISLMLCKNSGYNEDVDASLLSGCFDEAQEYVLEKLELNYLNEFQQSNYYCKYCIELLENNVGNFTQKLTIYDILYSEVTLFFFMEYLEQHEERDCLDFWTAAINFRKGCTTKENSRNELEAQADAMIIYEKFFSLQSESRLWMSDKLRCRVEERICSAGNIAFAFDLPLRIIGKYLEKKYFESFLKSQLFENYIIELKNKIHEKSSCSLTSNSKNPGTLKTLQRYYLKRSLSLNDHTCQLKTFSTNNNGNSNEVHKQISQHNTLLASMDSNHFKNIQAAGANLNIDSRQLTDPKLLWRRSISNEGGLKFGYVNSLGRYERDFEDIDSINNLSKHNWSLNLGGNKIKNAVRKLVNLPEAKVQEEIAWQVAEMIVKDVTRITLSNNKTINGK